MDFQDGRARDTFFGFINFRIDLVNQEFKKMKGIECTSGKVLYKFYKGGMSKKIKKVVFINF